MPTCTVTLPHACRTPTPTPTPCAGTPTTPRAGSRSWCSRRAPHPTGARHTTTRSPAHAATGWTCAHTSHAISPRLPPRRLPRPARGRAPTGRVRGTRPAARRCDGALVASASPHPRYRRARSTGTGASDDVYPQAHPDATDPAHLHAHANALIPQPAAAVSARPHLHVRIVKLALAYKTGAQEKKDARATLAGTKDAQGDGTLLQGRRHAHIPHPAAAPATAPTPTPAPARAIPARNTRKRCATRRRELKTRRATARNYVLTYPPALSRVCDRARVPSSPHARTVKVAPAPARPTSGKTTTLRPARARSARRRKRCARGDRAQSSPHHV
ncbi:hypothetical protein C8J57DRAFT_173878 [Mycena rebaudengoi]|nr:hypothetical protein C8J57DRAFT_173878 [Mycena rebaudengoi]